MEEQQEKEVTLKQALLTKYDDDGFELNNLHHISFSPKRKASLSQAQDLSKRTVLALDSCDITCAGNPEDIVELCPNLEELDLGNNKISDWREVFTIISQLHQLRILNLSGNPLAMDDNLERVFTSYQSIGKHTSLKSLILNNTGVSLSFVYSLLGFLTRVEELFLSLNDYCSIAATDNSFPMIKQLYLNEHCIKDWMEVRKVGKIFPNLEELTMTDNPLENISQNNVKDLFPHLKVLRLNKTAISDWSSIDALNAFPLLNDVKLVGIPLFEGEEPENHQLMIARLPNITKINGTKIGDKEREDAERFFIRYHMDDQTPPPRLQELIKVYGVLDQLADVNLDPPTLAKVSIIYEEQAPLIRTVNLKQTTKDFKKFLSNELGIASSKMKVYYYDKVGYYGLDEMKYPSRCLYCYKMKDGDEVHVHDKPN